jgi:hypothetical protein
MMSPSIFFKAVSDQSLSLWARSGAIDSTKWTIKTLEGMTAKTSLFFGGISDFAGFCVQCRIPQQPGSLFAWFARLQPADVADISGLLCDWKQVW